MGTNELYRLRRSILTAVADYVNPVNLDYIMGHPAMIEFTADAALDQWNGLVENGFLKSLPGSGGEFATLTELGKAQLPTSARRDYKVFVWGRMAM